MLLPHHLIRPLLAIRFRIQAKTPRHQTRPPRQPRLGIRDAMPPLRSLHEVRVLLLEDLEVLLGLPVPGGVGGEDEVHFLEGALVGFWVEGPDDEDGEGVDGAEDVEGFFAQGFEHGWEEEDLEMSVSATSMVVWVDFFFLPSSRCQPTILPHPMRCPWHEPAVGKSRPGRARAL